MIGGATEVRANDTMRFELADASSRLGTIYGIRVEIYKRKFFVKFLNNFLAQVTPFFFYAIGGYFVIQGQLTVGALVAVIAAYKEPWYGEYDTKAVATVHNIIRGATTVPKGLKELVALQKSLA